MVLLQKKFNKGRYKDLILVLKKKTKRDNRML